MSNDFIWGLTLQDFQNGFWNGMSDSAMLLGGMAAAAAANALSRTLISNNKQDKAYEMKHLACTVIGIGAGVWISFHYADRLHHVTFAAEKALKFLVISIVTGAIGASTGLVGLAIGLMTSGGAFGYFGRGLLRVEGGLGGV